MGIEQRKEARRVFNAEGMIYGIDGKPVVRCRLRDVSPSGAKIALEQAAKLPEKFVLAISRDGGVRRSCTLAWQSSNLAGARFAVSRK